MPITVIRFLKNPYNPYNPWLKYEKRAPGRGPSALFILSLGAHLTETLDTFLMFGHQKASFHGAHLTETFLPSFT